MNFEQEQIRKLMEVFDRIDSSLRRIETLEQAKQWLPNKNDEKSAFDALTSEENRMSLKAWYAGAHALNPRADLFRQILERAINEKLPLGNKS